MRDNDARRLVRVATTGEGAISALRVDWVQRPKTGQYVIAFVVDQSSLSKVVLLNERFRGAKKVEVHFRQDPSGVKRDLIYLSFYWGKRRVRETPKVLGLEGQKYNTKTIEVYTNFWHQVLNDEFARWLLRIKGWCTVAIVSSDLDTSEIAPEYLMSAQLLPQLIS